MFNHNTYLRDSQFILASEPLPHHHSQQQRHHHHRHHTQQYNPMEQLTGKLSFFSPDSPSSMNDAPMNDAPMNDLMMLPSSLDPAERPFSCPVPHCGGRFHRKFTLHEHMKTHTGEKPHACPIASCGKRFSTSGNLARHKRLHTLSKLKCPVTECTRIFTKKEKLIRHLKVHMGTTPHTCQVADCSKTFSTAGNLTRHMKTQHPNHKIVKVTPPANNAASSSSAKSSSKSLPDRIIRQVQQDAHFESGKDHHHSTQASMTTSDHSQDRIPAAPVAAAENISDHEIMELLDSLFVEPVLTTTTECSSNGNHNITSHMFQHGCQQQHNGSSQHVVYL